MSDQINDIPPCINDILADLKGFGIEDTEQYIYLVSGDKRVSLKIANIPSEEERLALLAVEEYKGYIWLQEVRAEIISRAISWINGIEIRTLTPSQRRVQDPRDGSERDIQVVLRDLLKGWGQEIVQVLWRVLMVHSQNIENRLLESFPEAAVITEAERRFTERARKEIEDQNREAIEDQITQLYADNAEETPQA